MDKRIKKLRKALDLTQQTFADRLGIKQNTIAKYETGRGTPTRAVVSLICREFNVNEEWLRTGNGEMFVPAPSGSLEALAREYSLSNGVYLLIRRFLELKPEVQESFVDFAVKYAGDLAAEDADPAADQNQTQAEWEREADEFAAIAREQYLSEEATGIASIVCERIRRRRGLTRPR